MGTEMEVYMEGEPPSEQTATRIIMDEAGQAMREGMALIQAEVMRRVPFRTGHLRRSINFNTKTMGLVVTGTVGTDVFYGPFLDRGTGLYGPRNRWIEPRIKKALRWPAGGPAFTLAGRARTGTAGAGAQWRFARRVRGIRPRFFMEDSVEVTRGAVFRVFVLHAHQAARRIEEAVHA